MLGCKIINQCMKYLVALGFLVFICACVHSNYVDKDLYNVPVISYEEMETNKFKLFVSKAAAKGEPWVKDALQVALRFIGPFYGKLQLNTRENDFAEYACKSEIILIEDDYPDDSVRGSRYKLFLEKDTHGVWYLLTAEKAWRCWPNRGHNDFSAKPCR